MLVSSPRSRPPQAARKKIGGEHENVHDAPVPHLATLFCFILNGIGIAPRLHFGGWNPQAWLPHWRKINFWPSSAGAGPCWFLQRSDMPSQHVAKLLVKHWAVCLLSLHKSTRQTFRCKSSRQC